MKRLLHIVLAAVLIAALCLPVFADNTRGPRLVDSADILTDSEESKLSKRLDSISEEYKSDVVIVTVSSTEEKDAQNYADDYFDYNGYGFGSSFDGMLLLISTEFNDAAITTTGKGEKTLSDSRIDEFWDELGNNMSNHDYHAVCAVFVDNCEYYLNGDINGYPFETVKVILISIVIGLIAAFIVTMILKGQLNSVVRRNNATEYVKAGSLNITASNDFFLYRNITRTPKQTSNSSGGGSHRSSSGRSHGGRSGRF